MRSKPAWRQAENQLLSPDSGFQRQHRPAFCAVWRGCGQDSRIPVRFQHWRRL